MGFGGSPNLRSISSAYNKGTPDGMHELRGVRISPGAYAPGYSVNLGFFRNVSKFVPHVETSVHTKMVILVL